MGHGTRSDRGQSEFHAIVSQIACELPSTEVQGCFLELVPPNIDAGMDRLVARGVDQVVVAPLLLFAAGHAKRDIPRAATTVAARCGVRLLLASPLGCHRLLLELSANRFRDVVRRAGVDPRTVLFLFVGRGSGDTQAEGEFFQFLQQRLRLTVVGESQAAFLACPNQELRK